MTQVTVEADYKVGGYNENERMLRRSETFEVEDEKYNGILRISGSEAFEDALTPGRMVWGAGSGLRVMRTRETLDALIALLEKVREDL